MKDEEAAVLDGPIRLKREGHLPDRDIITAFTADEQSGVDDSDAVRWLVARHRDVVKAGDLQCGQRLDPNFQTSEKTCVRDTATANRPGEYSSLPKPDNAIYRLAEGLARLARASFTAQVSPTTQAYFQQTAATQTGAVRDDMLTVAKVPGRGSRRLLSRCPIAFSRSRVLFTHLSIHNAWRGIRP